jgi:hypothetical protein
MKEYLIEFFYWKVLVSYLAETIGKSRQAI